MADITRISRFVGGLPRDVDLTGNALHVGSVKVGTTSPYELTKDMATLLGTIYNPAAGLPAANLSAGAKQSTLESKLAAFRVGVLNFVPSTGEVSDEVSTQVLGGAATDAAIGAGSPISSANAKGIFVGTVSGASDVGKVLIRVNGTDNGFDDGSGDEIYGVLSESGGVYTLAYKKADGSPYTIQASDASAKFDFYFIEIMDLYSFGVDRLLMPAIGGVVDATTASSVFSESSARVAADSSLQANIDAEITARTNADNAEITARSEADVTLQANIAAEATARSLADITLQANIAAEATARSLADGTLQANIAAEATARSLADVTLQANIAAEATARSLADGTLQANIDAEITARIAADSTLQSNISSNVDAEITARMAADSTLQANIDAEATARSLADVTLQANIDAEYTARVAADSTLQANIAAEATARSLADVTLQSNIDAEYTARVAADSTLQANIDAEATARSLADVTLQANIDAEATARSLADVTLQANIDAEATARSLADVTLQANIDAEATARSLADGTLQANINAEITARMAADSSLQTELDVTQGSLGDAVNGDGSWNGFDLTNYLDDELTISAALIKLDETIGALISNAIDVSFVAATGGISAGDVVALNPLVVGEVIKANASAIATCESVVGVARETKSAGAAVLVRTFGEATVTTNGTDFDIGKRVYVNTVAGQATKTAPAAVDNVVYLVGGATAINKVFINANLEYVVN